MRRMRNPNGFGSITKLTGNRRKPWMVRKTISIDPDTGNQIMKVIGYYAKYSEAVESLVEFNKSGSTEITTNFTFAKIFELYCRDTYEKQGKDVPYKYNHSFKQCEKLHPMVFRHIRLDQLEEVYDSFKTAATKRDCKTLFNQIYAYAIKHDLAEKNIASRLTTPKIEQSSKHTPFTEKELKELWKFKDEVPAKYWLIYIYTGLRPLELLEIKLENIHLDEQYMVGGIKNEYSKNRIIPIADCIVPFIQYFMYGNEWLLESVIKKGSHISEQNMYTKLTDWCKKHKMKHIPHDGRHTFATLSDKVGNSLLTTQKILGHSPQSMAGKVYIHKTVEELLEAVNNLPIYK